jgi:hypothetical protein
MSDVGLFEAFSTLTGLEGSVGAETGLVSYSPAATRLSDIGLDGEREEKGRTKTSFQRSGSCTSRHTEARSSTILERRVRRHSECFASRHARLRSKAGLTRLATRTGRGPVRAREEKRPGLLLALWIRSRAVERSRDRSAQKTDPDGTA